MDMSTLRFTIFCGLLILQSGCIEHSLILTVLPEDNLHLSYSMRGDRIDMEDGLSLLPDSTIWECSTSIEDSDDETVHVFSGSTTIESFAVLNTVLDWSKSPADSVFVKRKLEINVKKKLFGKIYTFTGKFPSRQFNAKHGDIWQFIPNECKILEDEEAVNKLSGDEIELLETKYALGIIQWNRERYEQRFIKLWEILNTRRNDLTSISQTLFSIALAGWNDDLRQHLNHIVVDDPDLLNLGWWEELQPLFLGRFVDLIGIEKIKMVEQIGNDLDKEYQISRDLDDDQFELRLILPGKLMQTDGIEDDEGGVLWNFSGKELLENDFLMYAKTMQLSYTKLGMAVISVIIFITLILVARRRLKH